MDAFFSSPDLLIYKSFLAARLGKGSTILHGLTLQDPVRDFARATASGLASAPRRLECRFLYDAEGSALFDLITRQPEYYLTRTETSLLAAHSAGIRRIVGPATLVELGSGNSSKTDLLLSAWLAQSSQVCYVPVDVSESALIGACNTIASKHGEVKVIGVHCDFQQAFPLISQLSPVLVLFLGSTIGNLEPDEMSRFLLTLSSTLQAGDFFLVGVDLAKAPALLEAAYNDAAGVTARFTRNLFARMNRELGCAIDTEAIEHVARYDREREQIEIFARFTREQTLSLAPLGSQLTVPGGELVQTEISRKFRLENFLPYLEQFGLATEKVFVDERRWFALILLRRTPRYLSALRRRKP